MKLIISKNKDGNGYYSKIQNDYNGKHTQKYLTLQIPKDQDLEYGLYNVDGFFSTYEKKDGTTELKFVATIIEPIEIYGNDEKTSKNEPKEQSDPFADFGQEIQLSDEDINSLELPF